MSNEFDFEQPEGFGGGDFLRAPGTYHFAVADIHTTDKEGKLLNGFRTNLEVLDGTVRDPATKQCAVLKKVASVTFFNGSIKHKDGGRFARQKQAAFFVATGILRPEHIALIAEKKLPRINLDLCAGKQLVMTVEASQDGKYLEVSGQDCWHVDDPASTAFPKNEKALALIPPADRRTAAELQAIKDAFAGKTTSGDGPGTAGQGAKLSPNGGGGAGSAAPVGAGTGKDDVDLGDL